IFVVDLNPRVADFGRDIQTLSTNSIPYGLSATQDANAMVFTNFKGPESKGFGILRRNGTEWTVTDHASLTLGTNRDAFDVENAREVVVTPDLAYAFVTGYTIQDSSPVEFRAGVGLVATGIPSRQHGI